MSTMIYFAAFAAFSWLIFTLRSRKAMAAALVGAIVVTALVAPIQAEAQGSILTVVQQIVNLINGVINNALTAVNTARSAINNYRQLTLFPQNLLNAARSQISGMIGKFRQSMANIVNLNLQSASLSAPQNLETLLRGHQTSGITNISQSFSNTFGTMPATTDASPSDRTLVDVDDALAQDSLKMAVATDSATDVELQQADSLEDAASQSAPGSAPFLTASALSATIRSQALVQKMYAAELREEAAKLAHENVLKKQGAASATNLRQALQSLLQHK